jgi:UDP-N-acetylmuramoyl-L-alanyl-D-glutamate--2,6-diaminopimelate ligase
MTKYRKRLQDIAREIDGASYSGDVNPEINSIAYDSRRVQEGSLFVAIPGLKADGSEFVRDAEQRGAAAVIAAENISLSSSLPMIRVKHPRKALAEAAWTFFDHPEKQLISIGITGTNGKTTTASVLRSILEQTGHHTGLIGTLGVFYGDTDIESPRTTPESSDVAAHFAAMRDLGYSHVVMEATSIGIDLERVWGIPFRVAIFTNLTRDHLDYHGTEAAYLASKARLFAELGSASVGIVNADDPKASEFLAAARRMGLSIKLISKQVMFISIATQCNSICSQSLNPFRLQLR